MIFSAEPNGVKVEARLIHIVIPRRIGAGFIFNFLLVLIIIGINITATEISSMKAALKVDIRHITQKNILVFVLNLVVIFRAIS